MRFRLGAQKWSLWLVDPKDPRLGDDVYGRTFLEACVILVSYDAVQDAAEDTIVHEIVHAVCGVSRASWLLGAEKEEEVIRAITPFIHQVLKDGGFKFPRVGR